MKQNIEIEVPDGMKAIYTDGKIEFVKEEPIRSKSWVEFCENHPIAGNEYFISTCSHIEDCVHSKVRCEVIDKNLLATKEDAEGILALILLTRLHDEWVGDWKPDWEDTTMDKWCIKNEYKYSEVKCSKYTHNLLAFPTREMAIDFMGCFKGLLETAKRFI